jgi:hypothetical protein
MKTRSGLSRRCAGIAVVSAFVVACGGGGGGDSGTTGANGLEVPLETVSLTCNVIDKVSRSPVAEADVNYQSGSVEYATKTDASGNCELVMPAAEVAGVPYPAASVKKTGYEPQTMLFEKLQGGRNYSQNVELVPLTTAVSVPVGGEDVMHLGDDLFEGTVNSQFQKKTDGTELAFVIADWAAKVQAGYTKATVYLDAKGWQTDICTNLIGLSGDIGTVMLPGGVSPAAGYWGGGKQVPFEFAVAEVGTLNAEVRITSGACNGTSDLDDFEINRIRVEFSR